MNWIEYCALAALLIYAVAAIAAVAGLLGRSRHVNRLAFRLTLAAFLVHTLLLAGILALGAETSRSAYLVPFAWCMTAVGLLMWWRLRLDVVLLFIPPLAFVLLFVSLIVHTTNAMLPQTLSGPLFLLHLAGVFIGIGLMAVAAGAAVVFLWQERSIKAKTKLAGLPKDMPALSALDRINSLATLAGFPCYSLGVLCGFAWGRIVWGTLLSGDPKELASIAIWAVYALLFHQRQALGWRGRKPALMALVIFLASLFSLLIVNTFLPTHHSFDPNTI